MPLAERTQRILRNIAWLLLERGGIVLSSLLISALLARNLGVENFGKFQYALAVFNTFLAATYICGAEVVVPALMGAPNDRKHAILKSAFALRLLSACVAFSLLLIFAFGTSLSDTRVLVITLGLMLFLKEPAGVVIALLQSETNNKATSIIQLFASGAKLLAVFGLFLFGLGTLSTYAIPWLIESLIVATGLYLLYRKRAPNHTESVKIGDAIALLKVGAPFWLGLIMMNVFQKMDRLLLENLSTPSELGLYSAAIQVTENINIIASILVISIAPSFIYSETSHSTVRARTLRLTLAMLTVGTITALTLALCSELVISILYGNSFLEATPLLRACAGISILFFIDASLNTYLVKFKLGSKVIKKWAIALVAAIGIGLAVIPHFGSAGALLGLGSGYTIGILYALSIVLRHDASGMSAPTDARE